MGEKMGRGKRLKLGNIYEIGLPNGKKAYARLFKEYTLAIYNGFYNDYSEVPFVEQYFRFIGVYKDLLTDGVWKLLVIENLKMKKMLGHHLAVSFPQMVRHHYIIKEI